MNWVMKNSRLVDSKIVWDLYHNGTLVLTDGFMVCYVHALTNGVVGETYQEEHDDGTKSPICQMSDLKANYNG